MIQIIILLLVLVLAVFPIWAIIRIVALGRQNDALAEQLAEIELQLRELRKPKPPTPDTPHEPAPLPLAAATTPKPAVAVAAPPPIPAATSPAAPAQPVAAVPLAAQPAPAPAAAREFAPPPVLPPVIPEERPSLASRINWEHFTGAKLLAWAGGLAAFLGAAFFVKYSFEHDLIPPEARVTLGFLFALSLVVGGLKIPRERYAVTAQTLCATGVVSLYAVTFACNSIYHFAFFGPLVTLVLMSLITATAFFLAVRMEARVVAILGMLGGFLTPILLSTGRDNPPGLFGYIALLDVGLIAVALHRRWLVLVPLGAAGTVITQLGWANKFFTAAKAPTATIICLAFCALFFGGYLVARRVFARDTDTDSEREPSSVPREILWSAIAFPFVAFGFAAAFLGDGAIAARPGLVFTFVLLADVFLLALAWIDEDVPKLHLAGGAAVFALLAAWTGAWLTAALLPWALAFYLLYAVLHTAYPVLLERRRPEAAPGAWGQLFPPLALLLMLGPLFKLDDVSFALWPCVLLVDLIAIALALFTGSLMAVTAVLVLTLGATGLWLLRIPTTAAPGPALLFVIGGFAVLFFAAGLFLARRLGERLDSDDETPSAFLGDRRAQIPAFSALLPFVLLILMTQRLPFANPTPVFGLALLLVGLTLALTVLFTLEWLPLCALIGAAALEYAWHARHFTIENASTALGWYLLFYAGFTIFPFVFRARFATRTGPWAVAALSGVLPFALIYNVVDRAWPNAFMGALPALLALPPLASLVVILRSPIADARARLNQLAWFGGVALLFVTLIFPIQFERQWITVGWALEGAALLWLFHRVPHPGLRATGVFLLVAAFVRLALNPAVLEYHARSENALLNWYLYSYGIVTVALFVGARLLAPSAPTESGPPRVLGIKAAPLLNALGTVLAFLLLNIEIADYFSAPGSRVLTFQFTGNFARDMTYTIAWALFALGLLLISIWKNARAGRYAALALLGVTLLKLFFHDLARLEALYRIGALFAVAVIAIVASFAYQRFLPGNEKDSAPPR